jgi:manganese-dependent inorganic pyrophosphatase
LPLPLSAGITSRATSRIPKFMSEILVIGHKNPDTDAICSAIGYAEFKRRTGLTDAIAARCGEINDRTDFVLKTFGADPPRLVTDVSPTVRDVMQTNVISADLHTTVAQALGMMDSRHLRVLPVLNPNRTCAGLVSMFKLSRFFVPAETRATESRRLLSSLGGLAQALGGRLEFGVRPMEEEELTMMIGAMSDISFNRRLNDYDPDKLVVIVGDRWDIQNLAIREKVRCLVVTGDLEIEKKTLDAARENNVTVILSPHDTATTANLCRAAMPVRHVLHDEFLTFDQEQRLDAIERKATDSRFQAFPVLDKDKRLVGILSKSDFLKRVNRQLILVDHNELSQAVNGADTVEIIEIIDHHRIGSLSTQQPILFRNEPVGSTSTIVADCFFRYGIDLPKKIAGLLLAGLVTDTLNLTSPTATGRDAEVLGRLEKISGVDATSFTEKLFASGSVLTTKPAQDAITSDCKEYVERDKKFSVAQIEEIGFDQFWKRKAEVIGALEKYRTGNGYYLSALLVTDVVQQDSLLVLAASEAFLEQIRYTEIEAGIFDVPGIVSRKKQLMPLLTTCLKLVAE